MKQKCTPQQTPKTSVKQGKLHGCAKMMLVLPLWLTQGHGLAIKHKLGAKGPELFVFSLCQMLYH